MKSRISLKQAFLMEDKELGDIFGGEERKLPEPNNVEQNTPVEVDLIRDLEGHIRDTQHVLSKTNAELIQSFLEKEQYDDIVIPPTAEATRIYRGIRFGTDPIKEQEYFNFLESIGVIKLNDGMVDKETYRFLNTIETKIVTLDKHLKYKPRNSVSSWTKDKVVPYRFSRAPSYQLPKIILVASTIDNQDKFFDLEMWYMKIDNVNDGEREVIGIGEIDVYQVILDAQ